MKGKKLDEGKPRIAEMLIDFAPAIIDITKVWEFGADKYEPSNWKKIEDGERRYTNAMLRHLLAEQENDFDEESYLLHATHVAWNAIARLWFIMNKPNYAPRRTMEEQECLDMMNGY